VFPPKTTEAQAQLNNLSTKKNIISLNTTDYGTTCSFNSESEEYLYTTHTYVVRFIYNPNNGSLRGCKEISVLTAKKHHFIVLDSPTRTGVVLLHFTPSSLVRTNIGLGFGACGFGYYYRYTPLSLPGEDFHTLIPRERSSSNVVACKW